MIKGIFLVFFDSLTNPAESEIKWGVLLSVSFYIRIEERCVKYFSNATSAVPVIQWIYCYLDLTPDYLLL